MLKKMLSDCMTLNGAVGLTELLAIHHLVRDELKSNEQGMAVDFGSHRGRSSIPAVTALKSYYLIVPNFYMVDLLYDLTNPEWQFTTQQGIENIPWGYAKEPGFAEQTKKFVQKHSMMPVNTLGLSSIQFLKQSNAKINYAFIDSDDHQLELVMKEVRELLPRMNKGGLILFHDFKNQYHGPAAAHNYLVSTGQYQNIPVNWDKIKDEVKSMGLGNDDPNSWHWPADKLYPTFIGCVRKVK